MHALPVWRCFATVFLVPEMSDVLSFREKRKINDELAVYGYVRVIEKDLLVSNTNHNDIPVEIIELCIKYYHIVPDRFDPDLNDPMLMKLKITDDTVLAAAADKPGGGVYNAFLTNTMDSGSHHWQFKLTKNVKNGFKYIGVWNNEKDFSLDFHRWPQAVNLANGKAAYYGVNLMTGYERGGNTGRRQRESGDKYCDPAKVGDIIHMHLDLQKNELSFGINDKQFGKALDVLPGNYRAVVTLQFRDEGDVEFQLLSYSF